ncbi:MAG: N-acetylglucosamine-6-phosphate deacetylase [Niabella sp.]
MEIIKIISGKIITPEGIKNNAILYIRDGIIQSISSSNENLPNATVIDAKGNYVSPGFIDIHLHGGGNCDFMDNEPEGYNTIAKVHAKHGTTAMTPTTLSAEKEDLLNTLSTYDNVVQKGTGGANFIGLHIEGPYFAMKQKGAQDPRYIRNPDPDEYREIVSSSPHIVRWSAAPELPGAIEFAHFMRSKNILPAIAHTDAVYEDVVKAVDAGYSLVTHLYSAMPGVTRRNAYRYAGVVEAAYLIDELFVEVIGDGIHMPPPLLKLAYKIKGADKIALITDAMRGATMPEGISMLGSKTNGLPVIIEDNVAKLPDRTAFAGSVATTDRLVRNMIEMAEVPLFDAVKMLTATPASIMKITDRKGSIEKGKDADIVIFDDKINIKTTIVNGNIVYNNYKN